MMGIVPVVGVGMICGMICSIVRVGMIFGLVIEAVDASSAVPMALAG